MAHHVTDANPTHHMSECGATRAINEDRVLPWYHMCGLPYEHSTVHCCEECGAKWSDI